MTPPVVVIEGPACAGKTRHARAVAESLCRAGIAAAWWHCADPSPGMSDPWAIALHYASARASLRSLLESGWHDDARVLLCDRWILSTLVQSLVLDSDPLEAIAGAELRLERSAPQHPSLTVVLTATDEVLDARLRGRGIAATDLGREARRIYEAHARQAHLPTVDTSGAPESVTEMLVRLVTETLLQAPRVIHDGDHP